jgi:hypothetical protein
MLASLTQCFELNLKDRGDAVRLSCVDDYIVRTPTAGFRTAAGTFNPRS